MKLQTHVERNFWPFISIASQCRKIDTAMCNNCNFSLYLFTSVLILGSLFMTQKYKIIAQYLTIHSISQYEKSIQGFR